MSKLRVSHLTVTIVDLMQCWLYGNGMYTSTKYAIKGIAECLRLELAPYNIRVNLVCPGFVESALLDDGKELHVKLGLLLRLFILYFGLLVLLRTDVTNRFKLRYLPTDLWMCMTSLQQRGGNNRNAICLILQQRHRSITTNGRTNYTCRDKVGNVLDNHHTWPGPDLCHSYTRFCTC